jgi:hypothetical protein
MKRDPISWLGNALETSAAWLLAIVWIAPLLYALWAAFHPGEYAVRFDLFAPLTLENFAHALERAPFPRYAFNTFLLVTSLLSAQLVLCTLAAYAFARFEFRGSSVAFGLVLVQLMITPEILIVENYAILADLGLVDTIAGIGLPLHGQRLWYFSAAPGLQVDAAGVGRSGPAGGMRGAGGIVAGLCATGASHLSGLRAGFHIAPLEQFSLAAGGYQLGGYPAADGGAGGIRGTRIGGELVSDISRHPALGSAAAHRLSALSAPVRAVIYEGWDQIETFQKSSKIYHFPGVLSVYFGSCSRTIFYNPCSIRA